MPPLRAVHCAWCDAEMRVTAPDVGAGGYFVQARACRECAGNNWIELRGHDTHAQQVRRQQRREVSTTQKVQKVA
jgi:hypothetical protein